MKIFKHRINTIKNLISTPNEFGIELDIRSNGETMILHHDTFKNGDIFQSYLNNYKHAGIISNTKELIDKN
jgi:hypothetical protein